MRRTSSGRHRGPGGRGADGRYVGDQQVDDEQPPVEVRLHPASVPAGEVLAIEVDLQPLDGALDAGPQAVGGAVASLVLGVVPVDLREVRPVDPEVTAATASGEAGSGHRTPRADRAALLPVGGGPQVATAGQVPAEEAEGVFSFADGDARGREAGDPRVARCELGGDSAAGDPGEQDEAEALLDLLLISDVRRVRDRVGGRIEGLGPSLASNSPRWGRRVLPSWVAA